MNCSKYRDTGELSDIQICVDDSKFNLHKFPLFIRSNYFKTLPLNQTQLNADGLPITVVSLDNFPGGSSIFALVADYCYNKEIFLNSENVIEIICASEYLQMNKSDSNNNSDLSVLAYDILTELFFLAKAKRDYKLILMLLEKAEKYPDLVEKAELHLKLLNEFASNLLSNLKTHAASYDYSIDHVKQKYLSLDFNVILSSSDLKVLNSLPLKWLLELIKIKARNALYQSFLEYAIMSYINAHTNINEKYNITVTDFKHDKEFEDVLKILFQNSIGKVEEATTNETVEEPKVDIIKRVLLAYHEMYTETRLPLQWLFACLNELFLFKADENIKVIIAKWIWDSLNKFDKSSDELNKIPVEVMTQLISLKLLSLKNSTDTDHYSISRLIELVDYYICVMQEQGKLTVDFFTKIATCVPKDFRESYDSLMNVLLKLIKAENENMSSETVQELLNMVNFEKLSEKVLNECKNCELIPQKYVTEAALALCTKLRNELDQQKAIIDSLESLNIPSIKSLDSKYNSLYKTKYPTSSIKSRPSQRTYTSQYELDAKRILESYDASKRNKTRNPVEKTDTTYMSASNNSLDNVSDTSFSNSDNVNSSRYYTQTYDRDVKDIYDFYTPSSLRPKSYYYNYRY